MFVSAVAVMDTLLSAAFFSSSLLRTHDDAHSPHAHDKHKLSDDSADSNDDDDDDDVNSEVFFISLLAPRAQATKRAFSSFASTMTISHA